MKRLKEIILENLSGKDLMVIATLLNCSISKLNSYLKGNGKDAIEDKKIVVACEKYIMDKYSKMIEEIKTLCID